MRRQNSGCGPLVFGFLSGITVSVIGFFLLSLIYAAADPAGYLRICFWFFRTANGIERVNPDDYYGY